METITEVDCLKHPDAGVTPRHIQQAITSYVQETPQKEATTTHDILCAGCSEKWLRKRSKAKKLQAIRLRIEHERRRNT